jgi:hypothetical protein
MGRVLQIRVMAYTYDPEELAGQWPRLYDLAFPTTGGAEHGMQEMVRSLGDQLRFGDAKESVKSALAPGAEKAETILERMDAALAEWNPHEANKLSEELEEALDELEREAKKVI